MTKRLKFSDKTITSKTEPTQTTEKRPPSNKKRGTILLIILWIAILSIVGYASFTTSRSRALAANRTAEQALNAVKDSDEQAVYELGSDEFKKVSDRKKVKSVVDDWGRVLSQATDGKPELVSKQESVEDEKQLTTLIYRYDVMPGKSKIEQKELFFKVVVEKIENDYKLHTFTADVEPSNPKSED